MKNIMFSISVFALLISSMACSTNRAEENTNITLRKAKVSIATAKNISYQESIRSTGRLAFNNEYKLAFKSGGIVQSIYVKEGQYVKKGTLLASLKLKEIGAMKEQAMVAHNKAQRDFNRAKALFTDSVATLEQLQNAESQLKNANFNLQVAQFNLEHSQIIAPANGIVQKILVQENEMAAPGNPVLVFGAENQGKVLITNLSDTEVVKIAVGDAANLKFDPWPEQKFEGEVVEIAGMANTTTGTYEVKIHVNDNGRKLKPGFIGNADIYSSISHPLREVPIEALVYANKKTGMIYKVENNLAIQQAVKIADVFQDNLLISDGLKQNDQVVVSGQHDLNGDSIQIVIEEKAR